MSYLLSCALLTTLHSSGFASVVPYRLNGAVTKGFEEDVGTKTSFYGFTVNTMKNSLVAYAEYGFKQIPQGKVKAQLRSSFQLQGWTKILLTLVTFALIGVAGFADCCQQNTFQPRKVEGRTMLYYFQLHFLKTLYDLQVVGLMLKQHQYKDFLN